MSTPSDYAGLELWYKTEGLTGYSDGDAVASWPDSSGNARTATAGGSPKYKTNWVNGRPAVAFADPANGAVLDGYFSVATTALASQPMTLQFLVRWRNANVGQMVDATSGARAIFGANYDAGNGWPEAFVYAGSGPTSGTTAFGADSTWFLATVRFRGATTEVRVDEMVYLTTDVGTSGIGAGLSIGGAFGGAAPSLYGDMAEIVAYSQERTDGELATLYATYWQPRFDLTPAVGGGGAAIPVLLSTYRRRRGA